MRLAPRDPCGFPDAWHGPYYDTLTSGCIPSGTHLFDVFAHDKPEELGGSEKLIGAIITTSDVVTSIYGDTRLFFRHKRFEDDLEEHPEWTPHVQTWTRPTFDELLPLPEESPAECPFSYLFGLM